MAFVNRTEPQELERRGGHHQMIRVGVFLNATRLSGGTYQYCQTIVEALALLPRDSFSPIAAYADDGWVPALDEAKIDRLRVRLSLLESVAARAWELSMLPTSFWRRRLAPRLPITKTLASAKAELWIYPAQDRWSYRLPFASICSVHDLMHRYERRFPEVGSLPEFWSREHRYRRILAEATAILVDSSVGREHVHESYGYPLRRIFALPYSAPRYIQHARAYSDLSGRYQLPEDYIFYPAQFWRHKNHENLIRAVALLSGEIPDLNLVLVGAKKNAYRATIELAITLGIQHRVHVLGYVADDDMGEMYRRARAMVMPTYFGPTNIPPLEAFATGCPAAVSRIYAMPDQVGDAAVLFDPTSPTEIAESIKRLWTDTVLRQRLTEAGYRRAQLFGLSPFTSRLADIIMNVHADLCDKRCSASAGNQATK